jgi:hypothetical protein
VKAADGEDDDACMHDHSGNDIINITLKICENCILYYRDILFGYYPLSVNYITEDIRIGNSKIHFVSEVDSVSVFG